LAVTVKLEAPAVVGVPEIAPEVLRINPAGKLPVVTLQAMVPAPPVDCNVALYAVLTTPFGSDAVEMASRALMVMLNDWFTVCCGVPESVAVTVNVVVPAAVGVPEIAPAVLRFNPPGKLPVVTLQVIVPVPPEAATVAL
jgi:hypothetical protein